MTGKVSPVTRVRLVLASRRGSFGLVDVMMAVVVMATLFVILLGLYAFMGEDVDEPEPKIPEPVKSPPAEIDMSWMWQVGGAVLLLAVAAGLGFGGYVLWKKFSTIRRSALTEQAHAASLVKSAIATLNSVVTASASYETDLAKQIDFPMMTDVTDPAVSAYLKDMRKALNLKSLAAAGGRPSLESASLFADAVHALEISFNGAEAKAERVRWSSFSEDEKRRLKDAQTALAVIYDASTTPEQRNAQYRRITKLLEGLVNITAPALRELSVLVPMLVLEAVKERQPQAV